MDNIFNKTTLNKVGFNIMLSPMAGYKQVRALSSMKNKLNEL